MRLARPSVTSEVRPHRRSSVEVLFRGFGIFRFGVWFGVSSGFKGDVGSRVWDSEFGATGLLLSDQSKAPRRSAAGSLFFGACGVGGCFGPTFCHSECFARSLSWCMRSKRILQVCSSWFRGIPVFSLLELINDLVDHRKAHAASAESDSKN